MSLKVIGGEFHGRNLQSVKGLGTRPLLGQVREALFNILGGWIEDKVVWDLFAGTGVSGIEALSRGARRVVFVEKSNQALRVLEANLALLGPEVAERCHVFKSDAWKLRELLAEGEKSETPPDLVFLDPPYKAVTEDPTRAAHHAQLLVPRMAPGGVLCFHFPDGNLDRDDFDSSLHVEIRRWGKSAIAWIEAPDPGSTPGILTGGDSGSGAADESDEGGARDADSRSGAGERAGAGEPVRGADADGGAEKD